jgi:hypothetical protein
MAKPPENIVRSQRFTLAFQLEGLCEGLRRAVASGQRPDPLAIMLTRKLWADVQKIVQSPAIEGFPEIRDDASSAGLLVMADVLNATLKSFLNADEVKGFAESAATWLGLAAGAKDLLVGR